MAKRKRDIQLKFRVTPQEREMIETKMAQFGTTNMAAYLRKMAIDGYVVKLDLPELRELVSLLRYSSNNLNQFTRRAHETGRIYETDLEDMQLPLPHPFQPSRSRIRRLLRIRSGGYSALSGTDMDGGRENRFLAGGTEISRRGGGMTAAPARTKAKAPTQNSIGASTVPDYFHRITARQKSCSGRSPIPDKARV